ncbi:MAG TPA: hypothetical protein VL995_22260 [Cellvibrio sp.]|nr:hypothetical protein [Cellvibrio sp.]
MKNSMKKMSVLLAAAGIAASATTMAAPGISYNYAAIQFIDQDVDDYDCNQDGLRLSGSLELNDDFFALGSYSDVSGGRCGSEAFSAGLGYQTLFGADSSIYGALSFENVSPDEGDSDSGLIAAVGLRGYVANQLEARVQVAHHTAFDGNTVLGGGISFYFLPEFSVTADVGLGSESSEIGIGLRMNF